MYLKFLVAGLIALSFGAGYYLGLPDSDAALQLQQRIDELGQNNQELAQRNQNLEQTLDLVKRQVQTDRIAYESLKKTVDKSEQERQAMLEKFQSQRDLLDNLKKKLESL
jgi:prefoldin subunit 5